MIRPAELRRLSDDAGGDEVPTSSLLRRAKTLASRLRLQELDSWVEHELNGYPQNSDLPSYRGPWPATMIGELSGAFGWQGEVSFDSSLLKPEHRDGPLGAIRFFDPLATLERQTDGDDLVWLYWPPRAVANAETYMLPDALTIAPMQVGAQMVAVRMPVPRGRYITAAASVRNRLLDISLGLERLTDGMPEGQVAEIDHGQAGIIVNNYLYGPGNVAVSTSGHIRQNLSIAAGDLDALIDAVIAAGIPPPEAVQLKEAVESDALAADSHPRRLGPRVSEWLGRALCGAGAFTANAGAGTVAGVVSELIKSYYGIH